MLTAVATPEPSGHLHNLPTQNLLSETINLGDGEPCPTTSPNPSQNLFGSWNLHEKPKPRNGSILGWAQTFWRLWIIWLLYKTYVLNKTIVWLITYDYCISSGVVKQLESLIWKHLPKAFWPPALPWNLPTTCFWNLPETSPEPYQNSGKCEVCQNWKVSMLKNGCSHHASSGHQTSASASFLVFLLPDDAVASCALIAVSAVYLHSWQNKIL